ncbi:ABC transporter permease [Vibrio ruber]|uniref:ABC transporter permease n=1 Tax=Vibrio ruber TaxID=184755 RepID=UPI00289335CA|nr:ABC transporter permease [Vibrio ruber]WNJ96298.1 ABC transporter permease [Vibrio ruber]
MILPNIISFYSLINKELIRFCKVPLQTIIAPATVILVLYTIVSIVFNQSSSNKDQLSYSLFLVSGLISMAAAQNAFDNNISSIVTAKIQGTFIDVLMAPILAYELVLAFIVAGIIRGFAVCIVSLLFMMMLTPITISSLSLLFIYLFLGTFFFSALGFIGGILAQTYDHSKAMTNFFIIPLIYLSCTFYSINSIPVYMHNLIEVNPFFYYVDGMRKAFIGDSETSLVTGISFLLAMNLILLIISVKIVKSGYKLKS